MAISDTPKRPNPSPIPIPIPVHQLSNSTEMSKQQNSESPALLILMIHSSRCEQEGNCKAITCKKMKKILDHVKICNVFQCSFSGCGEIKQLRRHFDACRSLECPTCGTVLQKMNARRSSAFGVNQPRVSIVEDVQPQAKRVKMENFDSVCNVERDSEVSHTSVPVPAPASVGCDIMDVEVEQKIEKDESTQPCDAILGDVQNFLNVVKSEAPVIEVPKIEPLSVLEVLKREEIGIHISGIKEWGDEIKNKMAKCQARELAKYKDKCQLCGLGSLDFKHSICCTPCGAMIQRNKKVYTIRNGESRHYLCHVCYKKASGETVRIEGSDLSKEKMKVKRNDKESELWVQCDTCELWQHQICALFNNRLNGKVRAKYTCPHCFVADVDVGDRKISSRGSTLGAEDLPRTILSDFIQERLSQKLDEDWMKRAEGKVLNDVPKAAELVVRVVSSKDEKVVVKQHFRDIIKEENYPTEFPYKSKMILLFQKIGGVEVCLFALYVQEYGAECPSPNQRRVCISYLDSVKYFTPDTKAYTGEPLRTFVYHEILVSYLQYCKDRGFANCHIWVCPPKRGDYYIFRCRPKTQTTLKTDKLRQWYLSMLEKASKEDIVVGCTNLYDHYFLSNKGSKATVSAARLPCLDGDCWHMVVEEVITKHSAKGDKIKVLDLMRKFMSNINGKQEHANKENFIVVHLQHVCSHCRQSMISGNRWMCEVCKDFQLCDECYGAERRRDEIQRHPLNIKEKHDFTPVEIIGVPVDTNDGDEIFESKFLKTRFAFLKLCEGNNYQFDTLRQAKHSSMMILYHLHNPSAPTFPTECSVCTNYVNTGQGWRCGTCADYEICDYCKSQGSHPHELTKHSLEVDSYGGQERDGLKERLGSLAHASRCNLAGCTFPDCHKIKALFFHGLGCETRARGGCLPCKKIWYLLQVHARICIELKCFVPRCKELKKYIHDIRDRYGPRRIVNSNQIELL